MSESVSETPRQGGAPHEGRGQSGAPPDARALMDSPLAREQAGIDACVHCGFCLPACPTYLTLEDENDSPRGRIVLMRALLEGTLEPADQSVQTHISRCLGCRACETACPSGVPYGHLLEATRATLAGQAAPAADDGTRESAPGAARTRTPKIPLVARLILVVFARPRLLRVAMAGGRLLRATGAARLLSRLPGRIGFAMAMLWSTARPRRRRPIAPAAGAPGQRGSVALLTGCVMDGLFAGVHRATERVLAVNEYSVIPAPGQVCCGALHAHAGDAEGARRLARVNIEAFERAGAQQICVNAAGCGAMMKDYPHLLAGDPAWRARAEQVAARVRDVSELLAAAGPVPGGPLPRSAAYDAPCHLLHAQRIAAPPLEVLRAIPELELVPLTESDVCCGSAGIYNLVEPDTSAGVLNRKLAHIAAARPEVVATGNPGCMMQIGAGLLRSGSTVRAVHPVELLDESYANRGSEA